MNFSALRAVMTAMLLPLLSTGAEAEWSGRTGPKSEAVQECSAAPDAIAAFADSSLEAAVRRALALTAEEELTCDRVAGLAELTAEEAEIQDLRGIEALAGLRELYLSGNPITDLDPLRHLANLEVLSLYGGSVSDLGPLRDLEKLTVLHIGSNSLTDIRPLERLVRLRDLSITYNTVSDLGPLAGLTELEVLRVYNNPISDISALRGLTRLTELHIHDLPRLSNIQPLLENAGLGEGDRVILMRSDISCADAAALRARGVSVSSICPAGVPIRWWSFLAIAGGVAAMLALARRNRRQLGEA